MVGTLEPRKGYDQVLDAYEHLWHIGETDILIVGKRVESGQFVKRLEQHP